MKQLLPFALSLLVMTSGAIAQTPTKPDESLKDQAIKGNGLHQVAPAPNEQGSYFDEDNQPAGRPPATEPFSASYNIESLLNQALPSQSNRGILPIHIDSAQLEFTNSVGGLGFHSVGMVFNPGEGLLNELSSDFPTLNPVNSYNFDSVTFPFWYNRPVDSFTSEDTAFIDTMAVSFRVEGDAQDTFKYSFTPTSRFTNTDTTELQTRVTFFADQKNPLTITKDTLLYPAYNIYDTFSNSNRIDTQMLMPDSMLVNSKQQIQVIDKINRNTREVVDTLVFQYSINPVYLNWGETEEGPFTGETILTASVPSNNRIAEMDNPTGEIRVPLRTEDEFNLNDNDASTDITVAPNLDVPAATEVFDSLGEPISVAATVTFKPGYPVDGSDTLRLLGEDNSRIFKNNYIATIQNVFDGLLANESYTNGLTILSAQRYGSSNLADFFEDNYFMFNNPPTVTPGPDNNASTARYYPFTFHISADETDNLDSNTSSVNQPRDVGIGLTTQVFPNPATKGENVSVELESRTNADAEVRLYNTIGKLVKHKGVYQLANGQSANIQIESSSLDPGIYFLNIRTSQGEQTKKISITK